MTDRPRFLKHLEKNGCYGSVVAVKHLGELGSEIRAFHDCGLLDDGVYNYTGIENPYHSPHLPKGMADAKSIITVATPQPIARATFHLAGKAYRTEVPPTYFDNEEVAARAKALLREAFRPERYRLVEANVPQKTLAVRSGLAMYGRNNVTYVPELGSFHRLTAFYTDYESPVDYWQEKQAMPLCGKCHACRDACPTGAIREDRFLIRADLCLTFMNERPSEAGFPKWVKGSPHNALVGCLRCQKACPYDRKVATWYEDRADFDEKETRYLLAGKFSGDEARRIERKLKRIGLDLSIFPRNLEVLIPARS